MHPQQPPAQPYGQQPPPGQAGPGQPPKVDHAIPARVLLILGSIAAAYAGGGVLGSVLFGSGSPIVAVAGLLGFLLGLVAVALAGSRTTARYVVTSIAALVMIVGAIVHVLTPDFAVSTLLAMIVGVVAFGVAMALLPKRPIP
ncbi:hypothetical protein ACQBAU_03750 [Propionibacteriaceae bacterium Y2011]|uniref:hypothetical protein n=1 Tax=Microlunatus sp. Y2014 TaxID=3418488 RepID=UPI003B44686E